MEADTTQELQLPLSVNLAAMSQRSRAVIEYYIKNGKNNFFSIAQDVSTADVIMLDYDHPDAAAGLAQNTWPATAALIILTVSNESVDGAIMVRKPLDSTRLDSAAVKALSQLKERRLAILSSQQELPQHETQQADSNADLFTGQAETSQPQISARSGTATESLLPVEPATSVEPVTSKESVTPVEPDRPAGAEIQDNVDTQAAQNTQNIQAAQNTQESPTAAPVPTSTPSITTPSYFRTIEATLVRRSKLSSEEKFDRYADKIELLCGPHRTLEQLSNPEDTTHRIDLSQCLSRQIVAACTQRSSSTKAVQFKTPRATVSVLCTQNKLYSSLSLEYKSTVRELFYNWESNGFTVIEFDKQSVRQLVDALNQTKRYSFSMYSFCWLGTLFSAQGRLPYLYDIDTPCRLRHWPNLTRLELIPECMEVTAAWANDTASIPQIVERTGCEPRYVTAFFNAACTLDLMTLNSHHD